MTMPELSLFHKILVLVEDKGTITLEDLTQFGTPRQTLGALGRLEGLGYIERQTEDGQKTLVLTELGDTVLADILGNIPEPNHQWDKHWRIILFDIPETRRTVRQLFRLKLLSLGARMLQTSVWITPHQSVMEKFSIIAKEQDFEHAVYYFEAKTWNNTPIDVKKLWHLDKLGQEYKTLFTQLERNYKTLAKDPEASFHAKCWIVALALVMQHDPYLPPEIMPHNWIGYQAREWYTKLRSFCQ